MHELARHLLCLIELCLCNPAGLQEFLNVRLWVALVLRAELLELRQQIAKASVILGLPVHLLE